MAERRVVITGMGCVSPVGNNLAETWAAVLRGQSGAGDITLFDHAACAVHFAHEVKNFSPSHFMDEKAVRRTARFAQFALAASRMATADSPDGSFDPERTGAVYASGVGGIRIIEEQYEVFAKKGPRRVSAIALPILMINNAPSRLAIDLGLKGPNYAVASGCSGSLHAIGLAYRHIQLGEADVMFTGGAESGITAIMVGGFASMGALSTRNDDPLSASRPFDRDRDGFVLGEGGATLILEEMHHALARKASIFAEVRGYGFSNDARFIAAPDEGGDGLARAMRLALADAGLKPEDIEYVNANGTSNRADDRIEAQILSHVFGDHVGNLAVSSTKGQTGHLLGGAGALETVFTAMAITDGIVPPTINHHAPDPGCAIDVTPNRPRQKSIRHALINNFGFGGHNACLCLARFGN